MIKAFHLLLAVLAAISATAIPVANDISARDGSLIARQDIEAPDTWDWTRAIDSLIARQDTEAPDSIGWERASSSLMARQDTETGAEWS
ncbi:hypothetical protein B0H13DRAFT_2072761 [Mycena leptocephala]|nr:hypothetical protein B0H13DRAFT_2072761 [Mycena leptocephala]